MVLKNASFVTLILLCAAQSQAVVVVDGVVGGDVGNLSPFETLAAAVQYANANSDPVIEIRTNDPIPGVYFADTALATPLTIKAGDGFTPVINSAVHFIPTNDSQQVTLRDLTISTNTGADPTTAPLNVGCNLTAENCVFDSNPAAGIYQAAVTCAVPSAGSESTLTLTSCTLTGHFGLEAGRSCKHYEVTNCIISAIPTALNPKYSVGLTNARNFRSGLTSGPRMGTAEGFTEISIPRSVNLTNTVVRGGMPIGWPANTSSATYSMNENSTFGPVTAVNSTIVSLRSSTTSGQPSVFSNSVLPFNQDLSTTFKHCTFHAETSDSLQAFGFLYYPGGQPATHTISNCFFDGPNTNYAIFNPTDSQQTLTGDANAYNIKTDRAIIITGGASPGSPFETTQHDYFDADTTSPTLTDVFGNLLVRDPRVVANALPLVPPVSTDKDGDARPTPVSALKSDIGADEVDETISARVRDWAIY